jgi:hypothetical protein
MKNVITVLLTIVLITLYACFLIWALNTLFSLNIDYNWQTIASALILLLALPGQLPPFKK